MSGHESSYTPTNAFTKWLDTRLPLVRFAQDTAINFPTPKNLNYWYTFGGILAVCLVIQIVTGVILAMHYEASVDGAFAHGQIAHQRVDSVPQNLDQHLAQAVEPDAVQEPAVPETEQLCHVHLVLKNSRIHEGDEFTNFSNCLTLALALSLYEFIRVIRIFDL